MRMPKDDLNVMMEIPGAKARLQSGFGDASGYDKISGEYFSLAAGVDTTGLFEGLEEDLCQSPRWATSSAARSRRPTPTASARRVKPMISSTGRRATT